MYIIYIDDYIYLYIFLNIYNVFNVYYVLCTSNSCVSILT